MERLVADWEPRLGIKIFMSVGSALSMKVSMTSMPALEDVMKFFNGGNPGFSCRLLPTSATASADGLRPRESVQEQCIVSLMEHLFKVCTLEGFVIAASLLLEKAMLPVTPECHWFLGAKRMSLQFPGVWPEQSIIDCSLLVLMYQVASRKLAGRETKDIILSTAIAKLYEEKTSVSLRLRVFRGRRQEMEMWAEIPGTS